MSLTEATEITERRKKRMRLKAKRSGKKKMFLTEKEEEKMSLIEATEFTERRWKAKSVWRWASAGQKWPVNFCRHAKIYRPYSLSVPSVSSSEPCKRVRDASGFSLIEVLVSMTILIVIVVMVTNMFRNASEAWDTGTQHAEMNTAARAAMEFISRELSCAMAGAMPDAAGGIAIVKRFKLEKDANNNVQDLSFIALSSDKEDDYALRGIRFRYDQSGGHFIETRRDTASSFNRYDTGVWGGWVGGAFLLITNVWRFGVTVCSNESDMMSGRVGDVYDSSEPANSNLLPACVDISIEMLGERDMARALSLTPGPQQNGFVMTNSRVYTTRVCFPNRGGAR